MKPQPLAAPTVFHQQPSPRDLRAACPLLLISMHAYVGSTEQSEGSHCSTPSWTHVVEYHRRGSPSIAMENQIMGGGRSLSLSNEVINTH